MGVPAGERSEVVGLVVDSGSARSANKDFLDAYLEFGIGHYTIAKLLSGRATDEVSESERMSLGIEMSALASAAIDNLVTWYYALSEWDPRDGDRLLVDILGSVHVDDSLRDAALKQATGTRVDDFCHQLGIPWRRDELRSRRIDAENWRYTVDQAKLNIAKVLEELAPAVAGTPRAWVVRYLSSVKHEFLVGAGGHDSVPTVRAAPEDGNPPLQDGAVDLGTIPTDKESLDRLAGLTGNAAIGMFCLVRLFYVTGYGQEPRSPAFVIIWQEFYPTRRRGRGP